MSISLLRDYSQTGAPKVWANAYGSVVDMLQAVLVDGYGTYAGLGWTKVYESPDTNTMVFRNNPATGSGVFLQVSHSDAFGLATNYISIKMFESMTGWNTGLSPAPTYGILACRSIGSTTGTTCGDGIHWKIIGDDKGFWLCFRPYLSQYADITSSNVARYWYVGYIGDYIPLDPSIIWPCFLSGGLTAAPSASFGTCQAYDTQYTNYWCLRDSSGGIGAAQVGISAGSSYETAVIGKTNDISPVNNQTFLTPIFIHDQNSKLLGILPGVRNPLRQAGDRGVQNYAQGDELYSSSDRILHLLMYKSYVEYSVYPRIGIYSGEGFRNVL
jgi:hypothetical protein